ncbi:hypothetical protein HID58_037125, partial [Brassica napus]
DDTSVPIRISHNLNKDKGLVFGYSHGDDSNSESNNTNTLHAVSAPALLKDKEDRAATSGEQSASSNFQINGSTVSDWDIDRKRPPAWVRRVRTNRYGAGAIAVSQGASLQRGRFYFDKRMFGKRGVEEAIIHGWEAENDSTELAKLKKASDWNSKTKIERLQTELEKESSKRPSSPEWSFVDSRGEDGQTIMHSRRSYSFMRSKAEADLWAMHWAVECMHNTHHVNVIFEASSEQLHNVLSESFHHLEFTGVVQSINQLLNGINGWSLNHALQERNEAAATIAVSVTRDRRYQSYMAQHEPAWLHHLLALEASSN